MSACDCPGPPCGCSSRDLDRELQLEREARAMSENHDMVVGWLRQRTTELETATAALRRIADAQSGVWGQIAREALDQIGGRS